MNTLFIIYTLAEIIALCTGYLLLDWLTECPPATRRGVRSRCSGHSRIAALYLNGGAKKRRSDTC